MGEKRREAFRVGFDRSVKLEFRGAHLTSDAGLLAFRELDDALGLTQNAVAALVDTRTGQNTRHGLVAQLRQSVSSPLAGHENTIVAEQLCNDPAMRHVVGDRARSSTAASTSQISIRHCSPRTLQLRLVKIGAKVVRHEGYTCSQLAETSVPRLLYRAVLARIRRLLEPVPI